LPVTATPDADHDEGRDEREFVEEIEEEDVDAGEHTHEAALHDEEQHQVDFQAFGTGLDGVATGGETDDAGEHEERERNAVETKFQTDAEAVEAGGVGSKEGVAARCGTPP